MDIGFFGEWGLIDKGPADSAGYSEPTTNKSLKRSYGLQSLYVTTKSKLYNLVRPISSSLPEFNNSPLILLGKAYTLEHHERLELEKSVSVSNDRPLWAMGFNITKAKQDIPPPPHVKKFLKDFSSKIWLTYRSQFPPIEPTTYTTDMGWGCMLRTGQMLLAQAFVVHYLGRDWRVQNEQHMLLYYQILRWFADVPCAPYSVHTICQIANARFGKKVAEWFEPTTISYTLSELVGIHHPEGLKMYVARDGMIYRNEIEEMCIFKRPISSVPTVSISGPSPTSSGDVASSPPALGAFSSPAVPPHASASPSTQAVDIQPLPLPHKHKLKDSTSDLFESGGMVLSVETEHLSAGGESPTSSPSTSPLIPIRSDEILSGSPTGGMTPSTEVRRHPLLTTTSLSLSLELETDTKNDDKGKEKVTNVEEEEEPNNQKETGTGDEEPILEQWVPVIILIPARLGVDCLNPVYVHALKEFLSYPQSLGVIGGKPHSSYYFVGYQDETLFYLDPHIINTAVNMDEEIFSTETYHTAIPQSMPFTEIDPSLALGFYCKDRASFDDLLMRLTLLSQEGESVVSVVDNAPDYVLKARRKSLLSKELMGDDDLVFM